MARCIVQQLGQGRLIDNILVLKNIVIPTKYLLDFVITSSTKETYDYTSNINLYVREYYGFNNTHSHGSTYLI